MTKITTSDFGAIHDALNKLIIGEVKAALRLVPEEMHQGASLCRIVASGNGDYAPKDVAVDCVWLHHDQLNFSGHIMQPDWRDPNDDPEEYEGNEDDDLLDISDFKYLIEQLKDMMPDGEYDLTNGADLHNLDRKAHDKLRY